MLWGLDPWRSSFKYLSVDSGSDVRRFQALSYINVPTVHVDLGIIK
jgi:hypothetical protein